MNLPSSNRLKNKVSVYTTDCWCKVSRQSHNITTTKQQTSEIYKYILQSTDKRGKAHKRSMTPTLIEQTTLRLNRLRFSALSSFVFPLHFLIFPVQKINSRMQDVNHSLSTHQIKLQCLPLHSNLVHLFLQIFDKLSTARWHL